MILVVCRGNIARSPIVEFFLNEEIQKRSLENNLQVISRGVQGTWVDPEPVKFSNFSFYTQLYEAAKPALEVLAIDISKHVSKPISVVDAQTADIILAVDLKTKTSLEKLFPEMKMKVHLLSELVGNEDDFEDPAYAGETEKHLYIYKKLKETTQKGFQRLVELL